MKTIFESDSVVIKEEENIDKKMITLEGGNFKYVSGEYNRQIRQSFLGGAQGINLKRWNTDRQISIILSNLNIGEREENYSELWALKKKHYDILSSFYKTLLEVVLRYEYHVLYFDGQLPENFYILIKNGEVENEEE